MLRVDGEAVRDAQRVDGAHPDDLGDVQDQRPGADARATAVLAVLAGVPRRTVAERYDIAEAVLERWVARFISAGRDAVADPGTGQRALDQHLGLVAHELRSPLAMIRGWAELLDGPDTSPTEARIRRGILAQVDRLSRLAEDALDAAGVTMGHLSLDLRVLRLDLLVAGVVGARPVEAPALGRLQPLTVLGDADRLGQVVDNLLENVRRHAVGTAVVSVRLVDGQAEVQVSSPGPPIGPGLARRMFEPFERGATAGQGAGLGLYVCRTLVAAHDGTIGLRADDDGNHFWVRLPVHQPAGDQPALSPVTT